MTVWIVSLEWNQPPSEVTGDTGIVGVYATEAQARAAQQSEQAERHAEGQTVYEYSQVPGSYCGVCGVDRRDGTGALHDCCELGSRAGEVDEPEIVFCDRCGAELGNSSSCDNDHDEWTIDVHCTEHLVHEP